MGFPSPAADYIEDRIDLNEVLAPNPLSTFFFRNDGVNMVNAFIPPKALLVVDRSQTPVNGSIVVAVVNGEFVVRYLVINEIKCLLAAANPKVADIVLTGDFTAEIWGVVTGIVTQTKDLKPCTL
ncbi:translesion error-prone DNA polymerase V autoproteolytic subunit [Panacibacter sp. DH6]|uniref:Translesion error-prone DNA polymerase V autoproteolytic subunit n=1 Tax=Panacibacter microcysteis TaxID=2793269 RepID=A0A931ME89_9BACT|nr:translesion error-prone DNA polymerase V autoproteolytic subunit [Panacibacter microcysteis]MBG9378788.1 translesion error-prone DNA polymerase V autoproteolytic subunit [Panacibacter microcysteis]